MDEPPSVLLKLRIPRRTIIFDHNLWESVYVPKFEHHCPPCRFRDDEESEIDPKLPLSSCFQHRPLPRVIAETMRYSSTTAIPWENMRLIHMLVEKVVYTMAFKPRIIVPKHPSPSQGGLRIKKKYLGSFFFFKPLELDLPTYVIRHVPIYGNVTSSSWSLCPSTCPRSQMPHRPRKPSFVEQYPTKHNLGDT